MTPFLHDEQNPFARTSAWPTMPQAPLRVARARTVLGMGVEAFEADEPRVVPAPVEPETAPIIMASIVAAPGRRPELRLTPLIAAAAVGAGGLLTLFLLIGIGPDPLPATAPAAQSSALAVGELVGQAAAPKP